MNSARGTENNVSDIDADLDNKSEPHQGDRNTEPHQDDTPGKITQDGDTWIKKQGLCLILDYQDFEKCRLSTRFGSEWDARRLKHDFEHLGFVVKSHKNLSESRTRQVLIEASKYDYSSSKYVVCCIISHGRLEQFRTFDAWFDVDELYSYFGAVGDGLHKIFIFQACQGNELERGVKKESSDSSPFGEIKYYPDFIVMKSAYPGTISFRTIDPAYGSYFINELCCSLEMFSNDLDLLQILNIVTNRFVNFFERFVKKCPPKDKEIKQMPFITSTLRSKVYFRKKIPPYTSDSTSHFQRMRKEFGFPELSTNPLSEQYWNAKKIQFLSLVVMNHELEVSSDLKAAASQLQTYFAEKTNFHEIKEGPLPKSQINLFLSSERNYSNADCLVCFIAAFSNGEKLFDETGKRKLSRQTDIIEKFIGEKCPSLVGKPKVFIFLTSNLPGSTPEKKSRGFTPTDSGSSATYIPVHADILEVLIHLAEPADIKKSMGVFCGTLQEQSSSEDLLSMMSTINSRLVEEFHFFREVSSTSTAAKSNFFVVNSTLSQKLYLQ